MAVTTPAGFAAELTKSLVEIREGAAQACIKAGADTQARARTRAPVDTGNLRNSITRRTTRRKNQVETVVGPEADYGIYVELGTSRMAAQPFMNPAADEVEPGFVEAMAQLGLR